jgi:hypothetical protein
VTGVRDGQATVAFGSTDSDPLSELIEVRDVLRGAHLSLDCDLVLGEVIHDDLASEETSTLIPEVVA